MNCIGIIPSRFGSTRFPGKALAEIGGMTMIERVYRQACQAIGNVIVATDCEDIAREVERFGGHAVMTSTGCVNGTARCMEAYDIMQSNADIVINIQGDEPFIMPDDIRRVIDCFADKDVEIASLARKFAQTEDFNALFSPDAVKVIMDMKGDAMYFSRAIIPYVRDYSWQEWTTHSDHFIHTGMYGYRISTLRHLVNLPDCAIEQAEQLEQLKWMYAGYKIRMAITSSQSIGVDTPEDLRRAIEFLSSSQ